MLSTREAYGLALAEFGATHDFYVMDADLSKATQTVQFAEKYPDRFLNLGIAECNLMSFAAGFATCGVPVVASTFAMFAAGRAYEQVRNSIAYPQCNVKIGATHGGVLIGADGGSHQCIEDIALMRAIPGMTVLCPCDPQETRACVRAALEHVGPVYMRFGRLGGPDVFTGPVTFTIGKGTLLREGKDVSILAIGDMVARSLAAAESLAGEGIAAEVVNMSSIKPLDKELLLASARKTGRVLTVEDHSVHGGLGGAVAEALSLSHPVPMAMVGMLDCFGRSGAPDELAGHFGFTPAAIADAARNLVKG